VSLDLRGLKREAFDYVQQSMQIRKRINDLTGVTSCLINMGMIYSDLGELELALETNKQALSYSKKVENRMLEADILCNQGVVYEGLKKHETALDYFEQSMELAELIGDEDQINRAYLNMGVSYKKLGNIKKALEIYQNTLEKAMKLGDTAQMGTTYTNMASLFHNNLGKSEEASGYAKKSLAIARRYGDPYSHVAPLTTLHDIYLKNGNYKMALETYKELTLMSDSLSNQSLKEQISQEKARAEFERKQLIKEQKEREVIRMAEQAENRRNTLQHISLLIGLVILLLIVIICGRLNLSVRLAEGMIFFSFLLFFEFLLLVFDPYIESWTQGAPALMFALNSSLALVIFPLHALVERFAKRKIIGSKN